MTNKILPDMAKKSKEIVCAQKEFGGVYHLPGAQGNEIYSMSNIAPTKDRGWRVRPLRRRCVNGELTQGKAQGLCSHKGHLMLVGEAIHRVLDTDLLEQVCNGLASEKGGVSLGDRLFLLGDRQWYDSQLNRLESFDCSVTSVAVTVDGANVTREQIPWSDSGFHVGDGVNLTCDGTVSNHKILALNGCTMTLDKELPQAGSCTVSVFRRIPAMDYICVVGDRLMGCGGNVIYISEAGNPLNWCATEGLGAAAPMRILTGGEGEFTGCACWQGYGIFFKEDHIYKLLGSGAHSYSLNDLSAPGVAKCADRTIAVLGGYLYYCSSLGIYRYNGGYPEEVGTGLGVAFTSSCGCADGCYYYVGTYENDVDPYVYIYDPRRNAWYRANSNMGVRDMTVWGNRVYALDDEGALWQLGNECDSIRWGVSEAEVVGSVSSFLEFGSEDCRYPEMRRLRSVSVLADAKAHTSGIKPTMVMRIMFDENGEWVKIGSFSGERAHAFLDCPVPSRRCDSYRLRLEMKGDWRIGGVFRTYEVS